MQGLLGRLPFAPLGPQAVRQLAEQKAQQYMPQGGGRIIPASGGVIKQPSMAAEIGAGLSGLGEALGAFGDMRKQQSALEEAKAQKANEDQMISRLIQTLPAEQRLAADAAVSNPKVRQVFLNRAAKMALPEYDFTSVERDVLGEGGAPTGNVETTTIAYDKFNPRNFREFGTATEIAEDKSWRTMSDAEVKAIGINDGGLYQINANNQIKRVGAPLVSVKNEGSGPLETKEQEELGKSFVAEYNDIRDRANSAQESIDILGMAQAIDDSPVAQEELPSLLQDRLAQTAVALGFSVESKTMQSFLGRVTDAQSFTGLMENLVLRKMQAQKGPQTENDAKRIKATVASLGNTPEARNFLNRSAMALAYRDVEKRQFWDDWFAKNNTFKGAADAWRKRIGKIPLFGINPTSTRPVFYQEFLNANREANPNFSDEQILDVWIKKYGK